MPRPSQLLHPARTPTPARAAATLLLLRDAPHGIEVLMTRRSPQASFLPGAYVFPGGAVDALDSQGHQQARCRHGQEAAHVTHTIAAIRESFEELGILLARRGDGTPVSQSDVEALRRDQPFLSQCQAQDLRLCVDEVFWLARWTADRNLPRRFDAAFLLARMPPGQTPVADESEQFEPVWVQPQQALERHRSGEFFMIFPTVRTLEHLLAYPDVNAALQACSASEEPLWHCCPRAGLIGGSEVRYMEHEPAFGELALVCPDGQTLHALDWQSEEPVALLKNVLRLTAPNPGPMTGPGTNSYLVGGASSGFIAIDPGPDDPQHLKRLWRASAGDIRMIVCSHSHPDHSPGAKALQAMCAARPRILGLPSAKTAKAEWRFKPDRALQNHELLTLAGSAAQGVVEHTLEVIYTPGHAANHLCLALLQDGLLFSGDHVLSGSTTVVDPPDGNMNAYIESLDVLCAACDEHQLEFILPAHGHVMGGSVAAAKKAIEQLKAHRLERESKVRQAMQTLPRGTLDQWLPLVYDDVPKRMWPVARRSLLAHVQRIESGRSGQS